MSKDTKSFAGQLKKAFVTIILIPVLCLGSFIFYSVFYYNKTADLNESRSLIEQSVKDLNTKMKAYGDSLRYLSANYKLQDFLATNQTDYLKLSRTSREISELVYNIMITSPYCKSIRLYVGKELHVLSDFMEPMDEAEEEDWYQESLKAEGNVWWQEDGKLYLGRKIMAAYPMEPIGILKAEIRTAILEDSFQILQSVPVQITLSAKGEEIYRFDRWGYQGQDALKESHTLEGSGWEICYRIDGSYYSRQELINLLWPILLILAVLVLVWCVISYFSRRLVRDLSGLVKQVKEAQEGNLDVAIGNSGITEISILAESLQIFLSRIKQLIREVYAKEIERQDLELDLLRSKISPHFLYNNLSAINWIALESGQDKIYEITTELATFYRTALNKGKSVDTLSVEVENIKAYLHLQQIAHENSFDTEFDIPEEMMECEVPGFVLQPLVENSVEHGIDRLRGQRGVIRIRAEEEGEWTVLTVWDNGTELYQKIGTAVLPESSYGYGTGNVHKRVKLLYGTKSGLRISADSSGTTAVIRFRHSHRRWTDTERGRM